MTLTPFLLSFPHQLSKYHAVSNLSLSEDLWVVCGSAFDEGQGDIGCQGLKVGWSGELSAGSSSRNRCTTPRGTIDRSRLCSTPCVLQWIQQPVFVQVICTSQQAASHQHSRRLCNLTYPVASIIHFAAMITGLAGLNAPLTLLHWSLWQWC